MKLFIIVNVDFFFLSHRLPIALAARQAGYEVTIVVGDSGRIIDIEQHGLRCLRLPLSRSGTSLLNELNTITYLLNLYRREKPDLVHHVTPKVVAYGSVAARLAGVKAVNAISGLGTVFINNGSFSLFRFLIISLFRLGLTGTRQRVIFQNDDDRRLFLEHKIIAPTQADLILGSGVDVTKFSYTAEPTDRPLRVILPARMLIDKGVHEFVAMARQLRGQHPPEQVNFVLVGGCDEESATAVSKQQLLDWDTEGVVHWAGHQTDMVRALANCHLVVFPSYREGLPKSLIEACAIGRTIVAFDVPGCREVVVAEENGLLVPLKDVSQLSLAVNRLLTDADLRLRMGRNGRQRAVSRFSLDNVVQQTLAIYNKTLAGV
jgi:glycosyltransferase involved in cell wall biosynthesis